MCSLLLQSRKETCFCVMNPLLQSIAPQRRKVAAPYIQKVKRMDSSAAYGR